MSKTLILRTCNADGTSYGGFQWPTEIGSYVEAPDWDPDPTRECGGGLHGLPFGEGDGGLLDWSEEALWMVVETENALPPVGGKCRFRSGTVVYVGDRYGATSYIQDRHPGRVVVGCTATAGDYGTATAGYEGTATAGERSTATAGERGTATAGYEGTATAGNWGTATAGDYGTATAGYEGTATAGERGTLIIKRWDGGRYRIVVGYIGEDGLKPNVPYRLDDEGRFVEVES